MIINHLWKNSEITPRNLFIWLITLHCIRISKFLLNWLGPDAYFYFLHPSEFVGLLQFCHVVSSSEGCLGGTWSKTPGKRLAMKWRYKVSTRRQWTNQMRAIQSNQSTKKIRTLELLLFLRHRWWCRRLKRFKLERIFIEWLLDWYYLELCSQKLDSLIMEPEVYINAHEAATRNRKMTCICMYQTTPITLPRIICAEIPMSITFRGLMLTFWRKIIILFSLFSEDHD